MISLNDKHLKTECSEVLRLTSHIRRFCKELLQYTQELPNCVGLAANQVGIPLRIFAVADGPERTFVAVNPKILARSDAAHMQGSLEGCMSFPNEPHKMMMRPQEILLEFRNGITGKYELRICIGIEAAIVDHELNHLLGKCIYD